MKFPKIRTFFMVLSLVMLLFVLIIAESNSMNKNSNLNARILSSQDEYNALKTQIMTQYNYSSYNISALFNLSLEKTILSFKGSMVERISFEGLTPNKPIWIEIYLPEKIHLHAVHYSHITPLEFSCYNQWCLLPLNPLTEDGSVAFNYSFELGFADQNSDVPFNAPSYTFPGNEKIALPLGLTSIGVRSAASGGKVSFLLYKTPWRDTKAFLIVDNTLVPLEVGEERFIPTPESSQFLLFAGKFKKVEGRTAKGTVINVYYPLDEFFEISPEEVLNWSKKVVSTYATVYSVLPSKIIIS